MAKSFHRGKASFRHLPCHTATIGASPPKQAGGASRRKRLTCILPCVVFVLCSKTGTELPAPALQGESLFTGDPRSAEHTSELQSLMRISYAVFCLKKKNKTPLK